MLSSPTPKDFSLWRNELERVVASFFLFSSKKLRFLLWNTKLGISADEERMIFVHPL